MRHIYFIVVLTLFSGPVYAQKTDSCTTYDALSYEDKNTYEIKKCRRERNYLFARQTLLYAPLSYLSGPYMELGVPKHHYILSADVIPQFVIGGKWWPFPIHITPRYMVRILDNNKAEGDSSLPVRTPSYIPGATMYFPLTACETIASSSYIGYASASVFHHSNGQDADEFIPNSRNLNHYNGNFSTNFYEGAYHFRLRSNMVPVQLCRTRSSRFHEVYGKLGVEKHFGTADSLKSSYSRTRFNLRVGTIFIKAHQDKVKDVPIDRPYHRETWRIVFTGTYISGKRMYGMDEVGRRINADLSFYRRIPSSPNTAAFLGFGYYGSDPYNIYYDSKPYPFIRVGIAAGFFYSPLSSEPRD